MPATGVASLKAPEPDAWSVTAKPSEFRSAVAWFSPKLPLTKAEWETLNEEVQRKAFTVAGVAQLRLVTDVHEALDRAIKNGLTYEEFKAAVRVKLQREWLGENLKGDDAAPVTDAQQASRIELIFRNNVQAALNAGRWEQAMDPDVLAARPMWMFDGIADARQSEICADCDGTVLPAGDPWWARHTPPLHHSCRSGIITLTEAEAVAEGVTQKPPSIAAQEGFGTSPRASEWSPDEKDFPPALWRNFEKTQRDVAE